MFNFGQRRIQKTGYSFLVPLPVEWVNSMKIGKGSSINIELLDDFSLRITPVLQARQDSDRTGCCLVPSTGNEGANDEYIDLKQ